MVAAVLVAGSEKEAAHRLGLSHSTVKHHLANARSKVGATATAQLVWILGPRLPLAGSEPRRTNSDRLGDQLMGRVCKASEHCSADDRPSDRPLDPLRSRDDLVRAGAGDGRP